MAAYLRKPTEKAEPTISVAGIGMAFGMDSLLVAAAIAPVIGAVLWLFVRGMMSM